MSQVDPLKVMRNPETLQAYRDHQRALRTAGQPWLSIALVVMAVELALLLFAVFEGRFSDRRLWMVFGVLMLAYGACFLIAGVRAQRYGRAHPLVLPEAPSPFSENGEIGWSRRSARP